VQALPPDSGTALVVEDASIDLTTCTELLIDCGMRVRVAGGRGAALIAIATGDVHVVIANVRLADSTGAELLREIRACDAALPVFFVSEWPADRTDTAALCTALVTAAAGYRIGRRARRRSTITVTTSPLRGEL
jgi:DNA-binding response OmpR family regulator